MDSNGLNPWTVKQFNLVWLEIIQWFGVVWIINVESWIGLGGLDLYGGNGLVGFRMGFWPICRLTRYSLKNFAVWLLFAICLVLLHTAKVSFAVCLLFAVSFI